VGASGNPGALLSNREIPLAGFNIVMTGTGNLALGTSTPQGLFDITNNGAGAGSTTANAQVFSNNTAGTSLIPGQDPPSIRLRGQSFNSVDAANRTSDWWIHSFNQSSGSSGLASSTLQFNFSDNGGAPGAAFTMQYNQPGVFTGIFNGNVAMSTCLAFAFTLRSAQITMELAVGPAVNTMAIGMTTSPAAIQITNTAFGSNTEFVQMGYTTVPNVFTIQAGSTGVGTTTRPIAVLSNVMFGGSAVAASAYIHFAAGTATAGTAPLKFTAGTVTTTAETGAMEYNGTSLFFTRTGTTRESILTGNSGASAPATNAFVVPATVFGSTTTLLGTPTSWISVNIGGTNFKIPIY